MKKTLLLSLLLAVASIATLNAQRNNASGKTIFQQAQTRLIEPQIKVYLHPVVAEMKFEEGQHREAYGPYEFEVKSIDAMTNWQFENFKTNALYNALQEADADILVGATFNCYVKEKAMNVMVVEVSGFPAKFVNFRNLEKNDIDQDIVRWVYPDAGRSAEQSDPTKAVSSALAK